MQYSKRKALSIVPLRSGCHTKHGSDLLWTWLLLENLFLSQEKTVRNPAVAGAKLCTSRVKSLEMGLLKVGCFEDI
ncbi:MAG: hypothetical protein AAGA18_10705 [Verrucomicrobiota bacterium]